MALQEPRWAQSKLLVSFIGTAGAGLSSSMILTLMIPVTQTHWLPQELGLLGAILLEGFCFVPLGLSLALAVWIYAPGYSIQRRNYLLAIGALAGFGFGGFAVFSVFGGLVGLVVLGAMMAMGLSVATNLKPSRVGVGFLGLAVALYILMRLGGDEIGMRIMLTLYPSAAMVVVGATGILWAALLGYGLVLFTLVLLWPRVAGLPQ